jgi:oligoribonuclease
MTYNGYVFIDLETTGIDAATNHILEVGLALYTPELELVDIFQSLVATTASQAFIADKKIWGEGTPNDFVFKMHQKSGLNDELWALEYEEYATSDGQFNQSKVFNNALTWLGDAGVPVYGDRDEKEPLCGSSLNLDRNFLAYHADAFNSRLSYRNIDVSGMRENLRKRAQQSPEYAEKLQYVEEKSTERGESSHRVLDDIRDSVKLLRLLREVGAVL